MSDQPQPHAQIHFNPHIRFTAEHVAEVLGITLYQADELLSSRETKEFLELELDTAINAAFDSILQKMSRMRFPKNGMPLRRDCTVELSALPSVKGLFQH